jgi:hypothetical protein
LYAGYDYGVAQTGCEEKERLIAAYAKASAELTESIAGLRKKEGTSPKGEYEALCRASEDAHMRNEEARLAFERHCQDHKC